MNESPCLIIKDRDNSSYIVKAPRAIEYPKKYGQVVEPNR